MSYSRRVTLLLLGGYKTGDNRWYFLGRAHMLRRSAMPAKILRLPAVKELTGLSRSTIYARIAQGSFPVQVSLGDRAVGWRESEIEAWMEALPRKAEPPLVAVPQPGGAATLKLGIPKRARRDV